MFTLSCSKLLSTQTIGEKKRKHQYANTRSRFGHFWPFANGILDTPVLGEFPAFKKFNIYKKMRRKNQKKPDFGQQTPSELQTLNNKVRQKKRKVDELLAHQLFQKKPSPKQKVAHKKRES